MAGLPQTIPPPGSTEAIATYDYFESFSGVAFVKFYLLGTNDSAGKKYHLTTDKTIGSSSSNMQDLSGAINLDFDIDIDTPFKVAPRDGIVTMTFVIPGDGITVTFSVIHVDSADTETTIGTVVTEALNVGTGGRRTCKMTMTEKLFKKGEKLRLNVLASAALEAHWDPLGRNSIIEVVGGASATSEAILSLPIEIPK